MERPHGLILPQARGALWMVLACVAFAGLWVMIRLLSEALHPFAIVVWRNAIGLLWLLPMILGTPGLLRRERLRGHLARTASSTVATFATFYAVASAPLAAVLAINYSAPLFATLGAMLFLGERVRRVRGGALAAGFLGMLLVLQPGAEPMTAGLWAAVVSALATAFSLVAIKQLTGQDDPRAVAAWGFVLLTPVSVLIAAPFWSWPDPSLWPLLLGLGACAAAGQLALSNAFAAADASAVMPYDFVRFLLITLAGVVLFGESYGPLTLLGGGVILASTIVLAVRERQLARAQTARSPES